MQGSVEEAPVTVTLSKMTVLSPAAAWANDRFTAEAAR